MFRGVVFGCAAGVMPPGLMTRCGSALRPPCGALHWAGTETSDVWPGYFEGALASGVRAAKDVLAKLGGSADPVPGPRPVSKL